MHGNIFNLVIPPSLRSGSINPSAPQRDSEEDSDSGGPDVEDLRLLMNEEPDAGQNTDANPEETAASTQDEGWEADETDSRGNRPARRPRVSVLKIDPPPVVELDETSPTATNDVKQWPVYDRIYVGGGIRSRIQLQSLLRLLKIGGIMIAPVQDELLKIIRLSEDRISRTDLLSVSFAPLVTLSANNNSNSIEPPPPKTVPSLLRLCARLIRQRLRTAIELRQNGCPTLGRLVEIEPRGAMKKKRKKKKERSAAEGEHSPSNSHSTDDSEASESDKNELVEDRHLLNGGPVSENLNGHSSRDGDQASPDSNRSESPDTQRDSGSMVRFLHHLLLRSRMGRSGGPTPPRLNNAPAVDEEPERGRNPEPTESEDRSRILVLNLSGEQDPTGREEPTESSGPRMRFHLRVAERLLAVIDGAEEEHEEQDANENRIETEGQSSEDQTNSETAEGSANNESYSAANNESGQQRQEKRRRGRKYQPPSYRYRDEMRRILSEELHLPEFFVRQVFIM